MASVAQIEANRLNARKSTGPRTPEGKERASRNALKHGLLAREVVIAGEDAEEFEIYREGMLAELAPAGVVETMLAERIVGLSWRLRRAERLQSSVFETVYRENAEDVVLWPRHGVPSKPGPDDDEMILGHVVMTDFARARVLDRLLMYERRIESSLYRTMAQLHHERQARTAAAEPEGVSCSEGNLAAEQASATPAQLGSFGANAGTETPYGVTTNPPADQEPAGPAELASFGADAAQERVSSLKCEVSSGEEMGGLACRASSVENQVSSNGSDLTLPTSHFERAKTTPDGVTTNREEQLCQTDPISRGLSSCDCQGTREALRGSGDVRPPSAGHTEIPI